MPSAAAVSSPPERLLVVMPTWLGDCVMATPLLRALRGLYPGDDANGTHIAALVGRNMRDVLEACPFLDEIITPGPDRRDARPIRLGRQLARQRFDMAVLLPNSFRAAVTAAAARIPRRVGYDRDGRGLLLTDRLLPLRGPAGYVPLPTREYYLAIARYLGATRVDPAMELHVSAGEDAEAVDLLRRAGYPGELPGELASEPGRDGVGRPLVLLNPGANYGDAKMWLPERFATLGDRCARELNAIIAVTGAPGERAILDAVTGAAAEPTLDLAAHGLNLRSLKAVIRRSTVIVTNDTGPRHIAAALGRPVVTVFGPTDPRWAEIGFDRERQVRVPVPCGPCQQKRCPLTGTADEHQCMRRVTADMVFDRVAELCQAARSSV